MIFFANYGCIILFVKFVYSSNDFAQFYKTMSGIYFANKKSNKIVFNCFKILPGILHKKLNYDFKKLSN